MNRNAGIAIAAAILLSASAAHAAGDADKGKRVYNKCKACHAVGENAKNRIGPPLNDIVGAKAGAQDYNYSPDLKQRGADGLVWDEETLSAYLENPKAVVPKGKMPFPGLKKESDRDNVIAYLKTFTKAQ